MARYRRKPVVLRAVQYKGPDHYVNIHDKVEPRSHVLDRFLNPGISDPTRHITDQPGPDYFIDGVTVYLYSLMHIDPLNPGDWLVEAGPNFLYKVHTSDYFNENYEQVEPD